MNEIKVYHQDGLVYFDKFRITDLMLLKNEGSQNKYLLILDIQSFDYSHSDIEVAELEQRFNAKINNELEYVWVTLEEFCDLNSTDDLNGLILNLDNSDDSIFLYFGWHVFIYKSRVEFKKDDGGFTVSWTATSDDVNYYDERAKENKIEITCKLNLFVFADKQEYHKHEKLKNARRETYFSVLHSLNGHAIEGRDEIDISEVSSKNLTEVEQNEFAWKLAIKNNPE